MYRKREKNQLAIFEGPMDFSFASLNPENRWIQMSRIIPWDLFEEKYSKNFEQTNTGKPAKSARMALGAHIIKEKLRLSDEETVQAILENPYLQYFIGLNEFAHKPPFDSSTMCWFRKRLTTEMLSEVNDYIIGRKKIKDKNDDNRGNPTGGGNSPEKPENKGTLILDATCAPADIAFPTDTALLNEGREKLEEIIDELHKKRDNRGQKTKDISEESSETIPEICQKPQTEKERHSKGYQVPTRLCKKGSQSY